MLLRKTVLLAALLLLAAAPAAGAATPKRLKLTANPTKVVAGASVLFKLANRPAGRCALAVRVDRPNSPTGFQRSLTKRFVLLIPRSTRGGRRVARVRCGKRISVARFTVVDDPGGRADSEDGGLTPGEDFDPAAIDAATVDGDVGGANFSTFVPLPRGSQARITQGPNGGYSHDDNASRNAVDIGLPRGTPLVAGFTGVVADVRKGCVEGDRRCGGGYGNRILLKAFDGTCAVHGHMASVDVSYGQQVRVGQRLGTSGNTGSSSGPHLHYDRLVCREFKSLGWSFNELGRPARKGETVVSENGATTAAPAPAPKPAPAPAPAPAPSPQPAPSNPAPTPGARSQLTSGERLVAANDEFLQSPNGDYNLVFQKDGNLVLYAPGTRVLYSSRTGGRGGAFFTMQPDGNAVMRTSGGTALFDTRSAGHPGAILQVQDDGNVVVFKGSQVYFATNTKQR